MSQVQVVHLPDPPRADCSSVHGQARQTTNKGQQGQASVFSWRYPVVGHTTIVHADNPHG